MKKRVNVSSIWSVFAVLMFTAITLLGCAVKTSSTSEEENINNNNIMHVANEKFTFDIQLGNVLGDKSLNLLLPYYDTSSDLFKQDVLTELATFNDLEKYMKDNFKYVNGEVDASEEELDKYVQGYFENSNVRVLGGNRTVDGKDEYLSVTVYNPGDEPINVNKAIVKSYWVLNNNSFDIEYNGIKINDSFDSVSDKLKDYREVENPQYSDLELNAIIGEENITVYVTDDKVSGFKVSY